MSTISSQSTDGLRRLAGKPMAEKPLEENPWRNRLYNALSGSPSPLYLFEGRALPAASLWNLSKLYTTWLRESGITAGDRLVLDLPEGPALLGAIVAALREGCTLALPPMASIKDPAEKLLERFDARAVLTNKEGELAANPDPDGLPPKKMAALREADGPKTPDARLLIGTSGTSGAPKHVAISDRGMLSVLDSHLPLLSMQGVVAASVLPWRHAFGFVLDLLPQLFTADMVVRSPDSGSDPERLVALCEEHHVDWLSCVPLTVERLLNADGLGMLSRLRGGVVGGAPVWDRLIDPLRATRLRVGYGQTEASPGISLGEPGQWEEGWLGRPIGCATGADENGVLWFSGPNACLGYWRDGALWREPTGRWVYTGDIVQKRDECLMYLGRADDRFKLANGRWVAAAEVERGIRDRFPELTSACVTTCDHQRIAMAYASHTGSPSTEAVIAALAQRGFPGASASALNETEWPRTPKGATDRIQITKLLTTEQANTNQEGAAQ